MVQREYPSNSTNYAIYLMLFFISWLIVTSASAYFVLAGSGFWSEKLDARKPMPKFSNSSLLRLSRSAISELFANYDYHGDFENVSEAPKLKRIHIKRPPQTFRKRIEIPLRPLAEVIFTGASDKFIVKNKEILMKKEELSGEADKEEELVKEDSIDEEEEEAPEAPEDSEEVLVVTGETMLVEKPDSEDVTDSEEEDESTTTSTTSTTTVPSTTTTTTRTTTTTVPSTTTSTTSTTQTTTTTKTTKTTTTTPSPTTVATTTIKSTTKFNDLTEKKWEKPRISNSKEVLDQLLAATPSDTTSSFIYNSKLTFFSLHSRFLVFICRLTFCFVALALALVILPSFFLVVAGTGCYIYSDHPMNRSSVSNKIGQVISINASILLFLSPCLLIFSTFTLFYTHTHELLCATIQLQYQQANGLVDENHQSLIETYSINSNHCSRALAPVQSLLLSSLLLCVSLLPCVFAMFKLVKYYFRMSSEFYWNAADNYAGRQFSKQQEFPRYQSTVIYPDDEMTTGYAVYGQI